MKRFKVYYIGLILAIVSMNWLTHFAVEPSINFNNVYTQRALLETLILLTSVVMLLLFTYRKSIIIYVLFFLSLVAYAFLIIIFFISIVHAYVPLLYITYLYV